MLKISPEIFFHPKFFWVKQGVPQCYQAFLVSEFILEIFPFCLHLDHCQHQWNVHQIDHSVTFLFPCNTYNTLFKTHYCLYRSRPLSCDRQMKKRKLTCNHNALLLHLFKNIWPCLVSNIAVVVIWQLPIIQNWIFGYLLTQNISNFTQSNQSRILCVLFCLPHLCHVCEKQIGFSPTSWVKAGLDLDKNDGCT